MVVCGVGWAGEFGFCESTWVEGKDQLDAICASLIAYDVLI